MTTYHRKQIGVAEHVGQFKQHTEIDIADAFQLRRFPALRVKGYILLTNCHTNHLGFTALAVRQA